MALDSSTEDNFRPVFSFRPVISQQEVGVVTVESRLDVSCLSVVM